MCGIVGLIKIKGEICDSNIHNLNLALESQSHRGPDASNIFVDEKVLLGHNRLSIIDLSSTANQPFTREDIGLTIVFNGEIYNYDLIKADLLKKGYKFLSNSDTEVILLAYQEFGKNFVKLLTGMFAFVIYNTKSGDIFAARDRFGEKPFFYILTATTFYFASELRALKLIYSKELHINQNAVVDIMEYMYINLQHTIYNEVSVFPPSYQLSIIKDKISWESYYSFPTKVNFKPGFELLKSQIKDKLYHIVESQLHADVPVATFLSSGIDSSVISAIAKELKPDILSITMSTGDSHSDESDGAERFAKKLGIKQELVSVKPDSIEVLAELLRNIQPLADASLIPTHLVTRHVANDIKVMLSGDAGDEVFGSYNKPNLFLKSISKSILFGKQIFQLTDMLNPKFLQNFWNDRNRIRFASWEGFYEKNNLSHCFNQVFVHQKPLKIVQKVASDFEEMYDQNLEKLSFGVDMVTRLPGDFLFKVDSAAMYSSLEVRVPFLDHTLVDLSFSSDMDSLMPNRVDKEITRSIYKDFAGYDHEGSKRGFSIPYSKYLQESWGDILETLINQGLSETYFNFNKKGILNLLKTFRNSPSQKLARVLFSVLVLEIWLRVFHLDQLLDFSELKK